VTIARGQEHTGVRSPYFTIPLTLLSLGQWAILFYGEIYLDSYSLSNLIFCLASGVINVKSDWNPSIGRCVVTGTDPVLLITLYFYSTFFSFTPTFFLCLTLLLFLAMTLDLTVLIVSLVTLGPFWNPRKTNSLLLLLYKQGIGYFLGAALSYFMSNDLVVGC
jgi:hypothetical protein